MANILLGTELTGVLREIQDAIPANLDTAFHDSVSVESKKVLKEANDFLKSFLLAVGNDLNLLNHKLHLKMGRYAQSEEDYPGGTPRFQLSLLAKDLVVFGLIPISAIIIFKIIEAGVSAPSRPPTRPRAEVGRDRPEKQSQIINFVSRGGGGVAPSDSRNVLLAPWRKYA